MNQGTQGYSLMKKTEGRKSRDTVPLKSALYTQLLQNQIANFLLAENYLYAADVKPLMDSVT
jgi:hypothetical protein